MSYSVDMREKALKYRATHTLEETAKAFDVSISAIKTWQKKLREAGSLENKPLERGFKKIDPEKLRKHVAENPDDFLEDIAIEFDCSIEAVRLALIREGITRKKNDRLH